MCSVGSFLTEGVSQGKCRVTWNPSSGSKASQDTLLCPTLLCCLRSNGGMELGSPGKLNTEAFFFTFWYSFDPCNWSFVHLKSCKLRSSSEFLFFVLFCLLVCPPWFLSDIISISRLKSISATLMPNSSAPSFTLWVGPAEGSFLWVAPVSWIYLCL